MIKKILEESAKAERMYVEINKAIDKVDDSLSVDDLAKAVAKILSDDYGTHNYDKFIKVLKANLK